VETGIAGPRALATAGCWWGFMGSFVGAAQGVFSADISVRTLGETTLVRCSAAWIPWVYRMVCSFLSTLPCGGNRIREGVDQRVYVPPTEVLGAIRASESLRRSV